MIELSKCPNCASEDKVTIAGKDFCMRCGTPNPGSAPTNDANTAQPTDGAVTTPQADQSTTPVSKFTDTAPAATSQPTNEPAAAPVVTAAPPQDAINSIQPQTAGQPVQSTAPNMPVAQPTMPTPPVSNPAQPPATIPDNSVSAPINQVMQAPTPNAAQPDPSYMAPPATQVAPGAMPITSQSEPSSVPTPAPIQPPDVTTTPDPVQIPSDQPLTQPDTTPAPPAEDLSEPKIHTHQAIMSLDKNDSGVFSDEQLDELSKISDQSDQLSTPSDQPKTVAVDAGSTKPTTFHTDIQPSVNAIKPSPVAQSAVSKVADNDIKVPDKNSNGKKVLKPAGIALSIVALFLVGAYIWQVNYPTLAFKIASAKAGMSASMPGYMPGGYKLAGEIQTNPGSVSYNLINGGQNKKISISQTKTDWDSQALAENYVAPKAENYLALQAQGLTIYMLGDSQATWVNKGTWYKIESPDQSLSQDQAIKIATSL